MWHHKKITSTQPKLIQDWAAVWDQLSSQALRWQRLPPCSSEFNPLILLSLQLREHSLTARCGNDGVKVAIKVRILTKVIHTTKRNCCDKEGKKVKIEAETHQKNACHKTFSNFSDSPWRQQFCTSSEVPHRPQCWSLNGSGTSPQSKRRKKQSFLHSICVICHHHHCHGYHGRTCETCALACWPADAARVLNCKSAGLSPDTWLQLATMMMVWS